jgi:tellurite resistance protein
MGLFSSLRSGIAGRNPNDDIARSVLALPLMIAASDGKIDDSEMHQILNMCAYSPIFHAVGAQRTVDLGKAILTDLRAKGAEHVFAAATASLPPALRETALCFAIRTALADGSLSGDEKQMLIVMGERLGVAEATFVKIFEVMMMLQRRAD